MISSRGKTRPWIAALRGVISQPALLPGAAGPILGASQDTCAVREFDDEYLDVFGHGVAGIDDSGGEGCAGTFGASAASQAPLPDAGGADTLQAPCEDDPPPEMWQRTRNRWLAKRRRTGEAEEATADTGGM